MDQTVLLFTGHLLDKIDRIAARFPYRLISEVGRMIQSELDQAIDQERPQVAISSLAAGGDIIFAMEALRRKIPLHVFLPFEVDKFLADSVKYVKDDPSEDPAEWEDKFHTILAAATSVTITLPGTYTDDAFAACNRSMLSYALERSNQRPQKILAIALMEYESEVKAGGAAHFVSLIESSGIMVKRIWPSRSNKLFR